MPPVVELSATLKSLGVNNPQSLLHLLTTNDAPTEAEKVLIRGLIQAAKASLETTVPLANTTTSALARRKRQRQSTRKFIDSAHAVLHPVRRLSPETIAEICFHALDYYTGDGPTPATMDTSSGPWIFGQICSPWRNVVVSLPKLWTVWIIPFGLPLGEDELDDPRRIAYNEYVIKTVIDRSGEEPLHVSLYDHGYEGFFDSTIVGSVLKECHRWKEIFLYCERAQSLSALSPIKGNLPLLETVFYTFQITQDANDTIPLALGVFKDAPALERVGHIFPNNNIYHEVEVSFPMDQLKFYKETFAHRVSLQERMERLSNLNNLRTLEVAPIHGKFDGDPVCLPQLVELETRETDILELLTLPALEVLKISEFSEACVLGSLFQRSNCDLQKLVLTDVDADGALVPILRQIPSLRTLSINSSDYDEVLILSLIVESGYEADFLPVLTTLSLDMETNGFVAAVEQSVIDLVDSRWKAGVNASHGACLQIFCFNIDSRYGRAESPRRKLSKRFIQHFEKLEGEGLRGFVMDSNSGEMYHLMDC